MSTVATPAGDGRLRSEQTVARVMLRPIGSPFALSEISGSVGKTSSVLGVFFLGCGGLFALLMAGGLAGGKAAAGAVILAGSADSAHRSILPLGRRKGAKASIEDGLHAQLREVQQEAGVREQL